MGSRSPEPASRGGLAFSRPRLRKPMKNTEQTGGSSSWLQDFSSHFPAWHSSNRQQTHSFGGGLRSSEGYQESGQQYQQPGQYRRSDQQYQQYQQPQRYQQTAQQYQSQYQQRSYQAAESNRNIGAGSVNTGARAYGQRAKEFLVYQNRCCLRQSKSRGARHGAGIRENGTGHAVGGGSPSRG